MRLQGMRNLCALILWFMSGVAKAQSLDGYAGVGISYDGFIADKSVTKLHPQQPWLISPQVAVGLRYHTNQDFNLMLDAALGTSRINLPAPGNEKVDYNQVRALITIGSGLYIPVVNNQSVMPFVQLGTGFFDFKSIRARNTDYAYSPVDYNTKHWVVVFGAGVEYAFRMGLPSSVNLRVLYTPLNIFPEPVSYYMRVNGQRNEYKLQGKLLQCQLTYQVHLPIAKWDRE